VDPAPGGLAASDIPEKRECILFVDSVVAVGVA
jgi:hypothetical protein